MTKQRYWKIAKRYSFDIDRYWKWRNIYLSNFPFTNEHDICLLYASFQGLDQDVQMAIDNQDVQMAIDNDMWYYAFLVACRGRHPSIARDMFRRLQISENDPERMCHVLQDGLVLAFGETTGVPELEDVVPHMSHDRKPPDLLPLIQQLCDFIPAQFAKLNRKWVMLWASWKSEVSVILWLYKTHKTKICLCNLHTCSIVDLLNHNVLEQCEDYVVVDNWKVSTHDIVQQRMKIIENVKAITLPYLTAPYIQHELSQYIAFEILPGTPPPSKHDVVMSDTDLEIDSETNSEEEFLLQETDLST
jgi:hypothetical protein